MQYTPSGHFLPTALTQPILPSGSRQYSFLAFLYVIVGDPISVTGPLTAAMFALMIPLYRETSTLVFSVERMDEVFADTFSIF